MSASEKTPLTKEKGHGEGGYSTEPTVMFVTPNSPYTPLSGGDAPEDYMIMSILTLLFCFWPLSIVALMKSLEVRNAVMRGDLPTAQAASRLAHKFNKLSVLIGIISIIIIVLIQLTWIIPTLVRNAILRGDLATAQVASRIAHKFNKLSVLIGIISIIIILLIQLTWFVPVLVFINSLDDNDTMLAAY